MQLIGPKPQGLTALTQMNPPLNLELKLRVIHGPVAEPITVTPAGRVQT